jgi:hypothetical protein
MVILLLMHLSSSIISDPSSMYQLSSIVNSLPFSNSTISSVATPTNTQETSHQLMEQMRNGKIPPTVLGGMIAGIVFFILIVSVLACMCSGKGKRHVKVETRDEVVQCKNQK